MRTAALFAGYGGLDLAVHEVFGAPPAWVAEVEAAPSRILAYRFPRAPNLGDVTAIDWSTVDPVDIITGGTPCQDLSHAGKLAGMRPGTRSGLWASMTDAIAILRPALVIWENVRGARSARADSAVEPCPLCVGDRPGVTLRALGRVLGDLADLGYDAAWTSVRAADVGAPHLRTRIFVLAWPAAADARGEVGLERPGLRPSGAPALGRRLTPRSHRPPDEAPLTLLPTPAVNDMGDNKTIEWWDEWAPRQKSAAGARAPHGRSLAIEAKRMRPAEFGDYAPAIARWEAVLGRPAPAPTEPTGKDGAPRLSPRFVEWMMGLPEGWVTEVPDLARNAQLKALGNGVVPQQAAAALHTLWAVRCEAVSACA